MVIIGRLSLRAVAARVVARSLFLPFCVRAAFFVSSPARETTMPARDVINKSYCTSHRALGWASQMNCCL